MCYLIGMLVTVICSYSASAPTQTRYLKCVYYDESRHCHWNSV